MHVHARMCLRMQKLSLSDTIMAFYWKEIKLPSSFLGYDSYWRGKTEGPAATSASLTCD